MVYRSVSSDDFIEAQLPNRINGRGPRPRVSIGHAGKKAADCIAGRQDTFLGTEHHDVSTRVGPPVELNVEIARAVLDYVRLGKGDGRKLESIALHLRLERFQLADEIPVALSIRRRAGLGQAGLEIINLSGNAIKQFLLAIARELGH